MPIAFGGLLATVDDFNRGSLGADYTNDPFAGGLGSFSIVSNALRSAATDSKVARSVATVGPKVQVGVTVASKPGTSDYGGIGVYTGLGSSGAEDGYFTSFGVEAGTDTWFLGVVTNGVGTNLVSGTREVSAGDKIGLWADDGLVSAWYDSGAGWTLLAAVLDTTYSGPWYTVLFGAGISGTCEFDDLLVADGASARLPSLRGVGTVANGVGAISPGLPSGTVAGDLLIMFCETNNQAITVSGWTQAPSSPQSDATDSTRLTVFYKIAAGGDATTTSDSGDHQVGRIVGIKAGTFNAATPFNTSAGGTDTTSDTSGSIPGGTTTIPNTLVLASCCTTRDASATTNFSNWTNSNLVGLTELIDNSVADNAGGGIGVAAGVFTSAGAYGNTAVTYGNASRKGLISLAVNPAFSFPAARDRGTPRRNILVRS